GWGGYGAFNSYTYNGVVYEYAYFTVGADWRAHMLVTHNGGVIGSTHTLTELRVFEVTGATQDTTLVNHCIDTAGSAVEISQKISEIESDLGSMSTTTSWENGEFLAIGDSLTAARKWPNQLVSKLGMNVTYHAKGGLGMIALVDGELGRAGTYNSTTDAAGTLRPLSSADVAGKKLIIYFGGYNNRSTLVGQLGDLYPTQNTIAGYTQYVINRIYEELIAAGNLTCKVLIMTPHCAGKYPYVDADGYAIYPAGSGQTMETMTDIMKEVANYNNVAVCDLWHNSGINKFTWTVYGAESFTYIEAITGRSGTYPHNGDQLHCSNLGYAQIGDCATGAVIAAYGN
ncbi:hypothetical protein SAMN04488076_1011, partial [Trichococcus palustris]